MYNYISALFQYYLRPNWATFCLEKYTFKSSQINLHSTFYNLHCIKTAVAEDTLLYESTLYTNQQIVVKLVVVLYCKYTCRFSLGNLTSYLTAYCEVHKKQTEKVLEKYTNSSILSALLLDSKNLFSVPFQRVLKDNFLKFIHQIVHSAQFKCKLYRLFFGAVSLRVHIL